jgi:PAS domain S-box-containing protein
MGDLRLKREMLSLQGTERREETALEALREAELRYRTVADFTYDWEYWEAPDGTLRYISPSCERITGYPAEQFLANPRLLDELVVPEDREVWVEHHHSMETREPDEIQFRLQRPDGEIRWVEHVCHPVTDEKGMFLGYRASNRDITERKRANRDRASVGSQSGTICPCAAGSSHRKLGLGHCHRRLALVRPNRAYVWLWAGRVRSYLRGLSPVRSF